VQAREAGVLDERQRLAREIHDTLAQGLTGIIAQLQAVRALDAGPEGVDPRNLDPKDVDPEAAERDRHLVTALQLARGSLTEARRSVQVITPGSLAEAALPDALREVTQAWSARHDVPAEVKVTGTATAMHADLEATLLRTAQEALTNVAKHAEADRVVLTLSYLGDQVALDVRDDGVGFDPAFPPAAGSGQGLGLLSMRQRVQRLAGMFEIDSEPGGGTAVSARVPAIAP
jgi:signal transduction histidine kinase